MSDYSRKITLICCTVSRLDRKSEQLDERSSIRVNRVWEEVENRWVNRLTIEPHTFCGLKEIKLKTWKIQRKNQQCVTIMQSRFIANKKLLLATPTR